MSRQLGILLLVWNVVLSALLGWSFMRSPTTASTNVVANTSTIGENMTPIVVQAMGGRDTTALKDARIAHFLMDSIQEKFSMVAESDARFESRRAQLTKEFKDKYDKANARYMELMNKDHTFSTQAERQADEQEVQMLAAELQQSQANSQEELQRTEAKLVGEVMNEIRAYIEEYNKTANFDYIISIEDGGQILVGNKGLDITADILAGLNARHQARKGGK